MAEIDSDVGSLSYNLGKAQKYRSDTMNFVKSCLGLGALENTAISVDPIINSFKAVGDALREDCTRGKWRRNHMTHLYSRDTAEAQKEQRQRFVDELQIFMVQSEVEQRLRLRKNLTSLEEFWKYRLGTSAVGVVLCAIESAQSVLGEYCSVAN